MKREKGWYWVLTKKSKQWICYAWDGSYWVHGFIDFTDEDFEEIDERRIIREVNK